MHLNALPEDTRKAFLKASASTHVSDLILIGGTALAIHAAHRISEDLDFVQFGIKLDRTKITALLEDIRGHERPRLITSLVARQEFENDGLDIDDFHQDWVVDGVKVTFFCPDRKPELEVLSNASPVQYGSLSIADADAIFRLKAMVVTERWTSRDAFDLLHFIEQGRRTVRDIDELISTKLPHYRMSNRLDLLRRPFLQADPGFKRLDARYPVDQEALRSRLSSHLGDYERAAHRDLRDLTRGPDSFANLSIPKNPKSR